MCSNAAHGEVYSIQLYMVKFIIDLWQVCGFIRVLRDSYTNKTDRNDMPEILLKEAVSAITITLTLCI